MATGYTDNLRLDAEIEQAIDLLAGELNTDRSEVIRSILLDWLMSTGWLPVDALDEESETQGTA
jgi:antitoxin component of RelBE/YafQ-DinJ toxin-antitoxin module